MPSFPERTLVAAFLCAWAPFRCYLAAQSGGTLSPLVRPVKIPCGGRIEPGLVLSALEKGAAGVALVTCREGECRHGQGPELGQDTADRLEKLIHLLGLEPERFRAFSCSAHETDLLVRELNGLAEKVNK